MNTSGYANPYTVAEAAPVERASFIRDTYLHLGYAILAFIGLEYLLLQQSWVGDLAQKMTGGMAWLVVLGAFMVVGWIAETMARSATSKAMQYAGWESSLSRKRLFSCPSCMSPKIS